MADNHYRDMGSPDGAEAAGAIQLAQAAAPGVAAAGRTRVAVDAPPQGTSELAIEVAAGEDFVVEFDPAAAEVTLEDANLVFTFADGARTVLVGFAAVVPPPSLILPDGTVVAGGIIVAQVGLAAEVLSLEAAAGPGGLLGGGNNVYDDFLGDEIPMLVPQGPIPLTAFGLGLEPPEEPIDEVVAITFPDDVPSIGEPTPIQVDEDGLPTGIGDSAPGDLVVPNTDGDNNEATFSGNLNVDFGAAGPGDIVLSTAGLAALGLTSGGLALDYVVSPDGHTLTAFTGPATSSRW